MTELHEGDCRDVLPALEAGSFDSAATDPPYELGFMGKGWDRTGVASDPATWSGVLRALKPGAYLAAFGGTRTYHRLVCAIEDAGFEIRDCLMWLYGTGMPKGQGCLKPGWEPIVLARKPGPRVLPLQIDGCRVPAEPWAKKDGDSGAGFKTGKFCGAMGDGDPTQRNGEREGSPLGRYPANVLHDGSDEVLEAFAAFGEDKGGGPGKHTRGHRASETCYRFNAHEPKEIGYADHTGTAARFFYAAKASRAERGDGNTHPTVKPLALMQWLVRLITPSGGRVLDPFAGSGTTLLAAESQGFDSVGIESDAGHCEIIRKRLAQAKAQPDLFTETAA